jgi:hypothetical protein
MVLHVVPIARYSTSAALPTTIARYCAVWTPLLDFLNTTIPQSVELILLAIIFRSDQQILILLISIDSGILMMLHPQLVVLLLNKSVLASDVLICSLILADYQFWGQSVRRVALVILPIKVVMNCILLWSRHLFLCICYGTHFQTLVFDLILLL